MFAVNEAESSSLICGIILAASKSPFECYFLVNLSHVQHKWRNKARAESSWSPGQLSDQMHSDLHVWSKHTRV